VIKISHAVRASLYATTATIAVSIACASAVAQTAAPAPAAADTDEPATIVVTGSLLSNPNLAQSAPVNVTTAEEITLRQNNVAEEVLRDIPGIVPDVGSAVNNGNGGSSFVNLRGLGPTRNIVLLDGSRVVPANLSGTFDLNNVPLALIDRVDALTGGASTTYGADAVSGVVNFITKKDFSGVEVTLGEQITEQGDGNYTRADVTMGANFDDGRGNAVFSIGYQESDPVYQGDRDFSRNAIDSFTGTLGGSGTAVPSRFSGTRPLVGGVPNTTPAFTVSGTTPGGVPIITAVAAGANNNGVSFINPATGATGTGPLFNFNPYNVFQTPFKRFNMYGSAHYQVSDAIEIYTRGLFSKNTVDTIIAPSGAFGTSVQINLNNPYLPAALRTQLCALNVAAPTTGVDAAGKPISVQTTYTPRFTPTECALAATATGPSDPNYRVFGTNQVVGGININPAIALSRRLVEGGPRQGIFVTQVFDYKAGLRGNITDGIKWDVSGSYGQSENSSTATGFSLNSRFRQALLANNKTACQDTTNGCVPVDVFGAAGSITSAMAAFLKQDSTTVVRTSLAQAHALVSGDLGFTSPFASDSVNFAAGGEYRHYRAQQRSDLLSKSGDLGGAGGAAPDIDGGYDVYEAIGELAVPLVQDKPFFQDLTLEAGVRYSHYTIEAPTSPKFNTTTWKVGGSWQPVKDVKFRGSYAHAVRAPNIGELFTPQITVLTNLSVDPCAGTAPTSNVNLRNVCLAQGAPAGTIGTITNPTANQANITTGGNVNVKPEKSNSYTFGVVLQPSFFHGFSATVDYYNITITDAITTPTSGDLITACFGTATPAGYNPPASAATDPACTVIRRNSLTGGLDGDPAISKGLFGALTNQGRLKTDGIDVALNYQTPLGFVGDDVKLKLSLTGNYTFHSKFKANQNSATSLDRDCVGLYGTDCASIQPKFQWNQRTTLTFGDIDVSLLWQHIDAVDYQDAPGAFSGTINQPTDPYYNGKVVNFNHIKAYNKFDLATRFGLTKNVDLTLNVQNLFDRDPPIVGYDLGSTAFNSGNTYPSTYDSLGRKYSVGVKMKF
jgi:iron complex outermembrane recepter protein